MKELKTYNYCGIALTEEREGTNCWGHMEDTESCIHLKFGHPFKYSHFTEEFVQEHKDFVELYERALDNPKLEKDRDYMLKVWREIINLKESGELVVICNMCDLECPNPESVAIYAMQQSPFDFTWKELTKE